MVKMVNVSELKKIAVKHVELVDEAEKVLIRGSGARFKILLELVGRGKTSFKKLLEETGLKSASLNHHLKVLLKEGYIAKRKLNPKRKEEEKVEYFPTEKGIEMLSFLVNMDAWKALHTLTKEDLKILKEIWEIRKMERRGVSREEIEKRFNELVEKYEHKLH